MDSRAPIRIVASCFALSAFAIALISGLAADRAVPAILSTAVLALIVCYILGLIVASIANVAVTERIESLKEGKPVPTYDAQQKPKSKPDSSDRTEQNAQAA
ncbi:MAG: hypothetical protein ACNA8P_07265 [Phycisphaerales bacterium]